MNVRFPLFLALLSAMSCRSDRIFAGISDSTFVNVMIDLRKLPVGVTGDVSERSRLRDSILVRYGITGPQLESTAVRLARDPERAAEVWRAIESPTFTPP